MNERERLIELLKQNCLCKDEDCSNCSTNGICFIHREADSLLENGVIVPLVKVGDKVWIIMANYTIAEGRVVFTENKSDTDLDYFQFRVSYYPTCHWRNEITAFITNDIGKTVFLTKEEAEKALKGGAV